MSSSVPPDLLMYAPKYTKLYIFNIVIVNLNIPIAGRVQSEEFCLFKVDLQTSCLAVGAEIVHFHLDLTFRTGCKSNIISKFQVV